MAITLYGSKQAIIQVVQTVKTDTWSETTSGSGGITNTVTGLTATITPSSASNKIFVMVSLSSMSSQSSHNINVFLYRNSTNILLADANGVQMRASFAQGQAAQSGENMSNQNGFYLDSPATTSATTYSIKLSTGLASSNTIYVNRSPTDSQNTWIARATSTITLMEVAYA